MEGFFLEHSNLKADVPVDLNTAAFAGTRIPMNKGDRLTVVINLGDSTAAVVDFTLNQHNAASSGTSKVLSISNMYFKKVGAAAAAFTKVEPTVAASNYTLSTDFSDSEGIVVFEVLGEDLDVNNSFNYFSLTALDSTAAKLAGVTYIVSNAKNKPAHEVVF